MLVVSASFECSRVYHCFLVGWPHLFSLQILISRMRRVQKDCLNTLTVRTDVPICVLYHAHAAPVQYIHVHALCSCAKQSIRKNYFTPPAIPFPLTIELRWRLVWMKIAHGLPGSEIAAFLQVSECSVVKRVQCHRIVKLFF